MNPLQSKINTALLAIIALSLVAIAIDTLRPRYTGYAIPYNMKMNTKTGELFYLDPSTRKFKTLDENATAGMGDTISTTYRENTISKIDTTNAAGN